MEPRGVLPGECFLEPPPLRESADKPVEALLTPPVLSASLCWVLLLRSLERERL